MTGPKRKSMISTDFSSSLVNAVKGLSDLSMEEEA
jgi:hypothetical protein